MPNIGVVDDRPDIRATLVRNISLELEDENQWDVEETSPLENVAEYPQWIRDNDIATLVVDERLREQGNGANAPVGYAGHDIVNYLRAALPTLPIFVITSHDEDDVLQEGKRKVEDIVSRDKFNEDPETYVTRMVRAGRKYAEEFQNELAQLSEISRRMVTGGATADDIQKASAIREHLARSPDEKALTTRVQWLDGVAGQLEELNALRVQIQAKIEKKGAAVGKRAKGGTRKAVRRKAKK